MQSKETNDLSNNKTPSKEEILNSLEADEELQLHVLQELIKKTPSLKTKLLQDFYEEIKEPLSDLVTTELFAVPCLGSDGRVYEEGTITDLKISPQTREPLSNIGVVRTITDVIDVLVKYNPEFATEIHKVNETYNELTKLPKINKIEKAKELLDKNKEGFNTLEFCHIENLVAAIYSNKNLDLLLLLQSYFPSHNKLFNDYKLKTWEPFSNAIHFAIWQGNIDSLKDMYKTFTENWLNLINGNNKAVIAGGDDWNPIATTYEYSSAIQLALENKRNEVSQFLIEAIIPDYTFLFSPFKKGEKQYNQFIDYISHDETTVRLHLIPLINKNPSLLEEVTSNETLSRLLYFIEKSCYTFDTMDHTHEGPNPFKSLLTGISNEKIVNAIKTLLLNQDFRFGLYSIKNIATLFELLGDSAKSFLIENIKIMMESSGELIEKIVAVVGLEELKTLPILRNFSEINLLKHAFESEKKFTIFTDILGTQLQAALEDLRVQKINILELCCENDYDMPTIATTKFGIENFYDDLLDINFIRKSINPLWILLDNFDKEKIKSLFNFVRQQEAYEFVFILASHLIKVEECKQCFEQPWGKYANLMQFLVCNNKLPENLAILPDSLKEIAAKAILTPLEVANIPFLNLIQFTLFNKNQNQTIVLLTLLSSEQKKEALNAKFSGSDAIFSYLFKKKEAYPFLLRLIFDQPEITSLAEDQVIPLIQNAPLLSNPSAFLNKLPIAIVKKAFTSKFAFKSNEGGIIVFENLIHFIFKNCKLEVQNRLFMIISFYLKEDIKAELLKDWDEQWNGLLYLINTPEWGLTTLLNIFTQEELTKCIFSDNNTALFYRIVSSKTNTTIGLDNFLHFMFKTDTELMQYLHSLKPNDRNYNSMHLAVLSGDFNKFNYMIKILGQYAREKCTELTCDGNIIQLIREHGNIEMLATLMTVFGNETMQSYYTNSVMNTLTKQNPHRDAINEFAIKHNLIPYPQMKNEDNSLSAVGRESVDSGGRLISFWTVPNASPLQDESENQNKRKVQDDQKEDDDTNKKQHLG